MDEGYNFSKIEASFKKYISSGNKILGKNTVKNYISDVRHFLGWYHSTQNPIESGTELASNASYFAKIDTKSVNDYIMYLQNTNNSPLTVKRRISSLSTFLKYCLQNGLIEDHYLKQLREMQKKESKPVSPLAQPQAIATTPIDVTDHVPDFSTSNTAPALVTHHNRRSLSFTMIILLGVISVALNYALSNDSGSKPASNLLVSQASSNNSRMLTFRGRLSDSLGNPISGKTDVRFKIYSSPTANRALFESNACTVYPDVEGNFEVAIGSSERDINTLGCDKKIPAELFLANTPLYLGLTVGTNAEMKPRQQIANVGLADNALRLNGLALGGNIDNIPYIGATGEIALTSENPNLNATAVSETFKISSSRSIMLQSAAKGDISLSATESGTIRFLTGGSEVDRMTIAQNGNVGIGTINPAYFRLEVSGSVGPSLTKTYNLGAANRLWNTLYVNRICFDEQESICTTGVSSFFTPSYATSSALTSVGSASVIGSDLLVGSNATSSANIKLSGSTGNPSFIRTGYLGINTTTPESALDVLGSARFGGNTIDITTHSNQDLTLVANGTGIIVLDDTTTVGGNLSGGLNVTSGTTTLDIAGTATANALCHSTQSGTDNEQIVDCGGTPIADFAEMYPVAEGADYGDVMSLSSHEVKTKDGQYIRKLSASTKPFDQHLIGVVSDNYGDFISVGHNLNPEDNPKPIALKGRVPVKIAATSKAIKAGDYLTSSLEPGKASKATKAGVMIGKALEDWSPTSGKNQIMVFVSTAYADPGVNSNNLVENLAELIGSLQSPILFNQKIISPIVKTDSLIAREISADVIKPNENNITIDLGPEASEASKLLVKGFDSREVASIDNEGNASFSGTLTADTIETKNIKELERRLASAVEKTTYNQDINAIQSVLGEITNSKLPDPTYYPPAPSGMVTDESMSQLLDSLTVMGDTNLFNLNVHDKIYTLQDELKISALASIEFMDGAIVMTRSGNITVRGTVTAKEIKTNKLVLTDEGEQETARIDASGAAQFASLSLAARTSGATPSAIIASQKNFAENGVLLPAIESKSDSAGMGLIPEDEPEVAVYNERLKSESLIFLTPVHQSTTAAALSVAKKVTCEGAAAQQPCRPYFTVSAGTNTHSDVYFNWFILNSR